MPLIANYFYLFLLSIVFASLATAIGIGGASLFSPFFMLVLNLPPPVAIGTALITEVFGFSSAVIGYAYRRLIDYKLAIKVLAGAVPLAITGVLASHFIGSDYLKLIFGIGLIILAIKFLQKPDARDIEVLDRNIKNEYGKDGKTTIVSRKGEVIRYTVCNIHRGRIITALGGFFLGLISTGLGELNDFFFLRACKVPSKVATGTSVLIVSLTALIAAGGHFRFFLQMDEQILRNIFRIIVFTVPGVILGGQLGSVIAGKINTKLLEAVISIVFIIIGFVTFLEVVLKNV